MIMPKPGEMAHAPAWDNYVVAQVVQASLGLIPPSAISIRVEISDAEIHLRFQLSALTEQDESDIADIVEDLEDLIGFVVPVTSALNLGEEDRAAVVEDSRVRWTYMRHDGDG